MVFYYYHLPHNSSFPNKWIFLFKKIYKIILFLQLWRKFSPCSQRLCGNDAQDADCEQPYPEGTHLATFCGGNSSEQSVPAETWQQGTRYWKVLAERNANCSVRHQSHCQACSFGFSDHWRVWGYLSLCPVGSGSKMEPLFMPWL